MGATGITGITTGILEIHDTTIFNNTLEALDTGKIVYLYYENFGYSMISYFNVVTEGTILINITTTDGVQYNIRPSEGYNISDLYTPTNIVVSEATEVPV